MEQQYNRIWPVLLVDDEWSDIRDLEGVLREIASERYSRGSGTKRPVFPVHATSPDEAIDYLLKSQKEKTRVSAIICDNHMKDDDFDSIDGDDFLKVITGNVSYCFRDNDLDRDELESMWSFKELKSYCGIPHSGVMEILEEKFGEKGVNNYLNFVDYFFDGNNDPALVMLCGSPSEVKREGIEDVFLVQKSISGRKNGLIKRYTACERIVLDFLVSKGVLPADMTQKILETHPRLSSATPPSGMCFRPLKEPDE